MSNGEKDALASRRVRSIQVIILALVLGIVALLAIAVFLRAGGGLNRPVGPPVLSYVAFVFAAVGLVSSAFVPELFVSISRRKLARAADAPSSLDEKALWQIYSSRAVIGGALAQGTAFLNLIAFMVEGNILCVALTLVALAFIALRFPSVEKATDWIEHQRQVIADQRQTPQS
jgi:hypothetical protein